MKEFGSNNTMVLQFISTADIWMTAFAYSTTKGCFGSFHFMNDKHPNIRFTMEKEVNHKLLFLDVLLDNSNPPPLLTFIFHKTTYTGILTNFLSFAPLPYRDLTEIFKDINILPRLPTSRQDLERRISPRSRQNCEHLAEISPKLGTSH